MKQIIASSPFSRQQATSIQEAEEPERNPVAGPQLDVIGRNETSRNIRNLLEGLTLPPDLEEKFSVDKEIPFPRI